MFAHPKMLQLTLWQTNIYHLFPDCQSPLVIECAVELYITHKGKFDLQTARLVKQLLISH